MPECRAVAAEGLAWPSAPQRRHTAARGMRPVVPVVMTSSGSHTLRTRGEVPELIGDAPITVRSEPLTECNLPVGKVWQTCRRYLDDHQHAQVRATFDLGASPAPAAFYPGELLCPVWPRQASDQAEDVGTQGRNHWFFRYTRRPPPITGAPIAHRLPLRPIIPPHRPSTGGICLRIFGYRPGLGN